MLSSYQALSTKGCCATWISPILGHLLPSSSALSCQWKESEWECTIQLPTRLRTHYIEVELVLSLCEKQENVIEGSAI